MLGFAFDLVAKNGQFTACQCCTREHRDPCCCQSRGVHTAELQCCRTVGRAAVGLRAAAHNSAPAAPHLQLCPCSSVPSALYLQLCPCSSAPSALHLQLCTFSSVPAALHLQLCPCSSAPAALHLQLCTCSSVPAAPCTQLPALQALHSSDPPLSHSQVCSWMNSGQASG